MLVLLIEIPSDVFCLIGTFSAYSIFHWTLAQFQIIKTYFFTLLYYLYEFVLVFDYEERLGFLHIAILE